VHQWDPYDWIVSVSDHLAQTTRQNSQLIDQLKRLEISQAKTEAMLHEMLLHLALAEVKIEQLEKSQ
jgi:hypothetical protein